MSNINRKILYDKLMAEGKVKEAAVLIIHHKDMAKTAVGKGATAKVDGKDMRYDEEEKKWKEETKSKVKK